MTTFSTPGYNATMSACEKGGQWIHALSLLALLKKSEVTPNVIGYSDL